MTIKVGNNKAIENAAIGRAVFKAAKPSFGGDVSSLAKIQQNSTVLGPKFSNFLEKVNQNVSSPEQRLILGVTALFLQPFIDLNNKRVNEETRLMSFSRTLSKIVVGTTVGVLVRKGCIKLAQNYTKVVPQMKEACKDAIAELRKKGENPENHPVRWAKRGDKNYLLAPDYVRTYMDDYYKNYVNALGSVMGIGVSLVTNFLIDAPLTQIMTNSVYKKITSDKNKSADIAAKEQAGASVVSMKGKPVSFGGNIAVQTAQKVAQKTLNNTDLAMKKVYVGFNEKYVPKENEEPVFCDIRELKRWFWKNVANNPGSMLMHTGALGWAASSAAQITGIALNDKIDSSKKKFLIPQEFADAAGNIALYYLVTLSAKKLVESKFDDGSICAKSLIDKIKQELESKKEEKDIFKNKLFVSALDALPESKKLFRIHKNGASILATLAASVLSCNILTPYFRNFYGSRCQEKLKDKTFNVYHNDPLYSVEDDVPIETTKKTEPFKRFIV